MAGHLGPNQKEKLELAWGLTKVTHNTSWAQPTEAQTQTPTTQHRSNTKNSLGPSPRRLNSTQNRLRPLLPNHTRPLGYPMFQILNRCATSTPGLLWKVTSPSQPRASMRHHGVTPPYVARRQ